VECLGALKEATPQGEATTIATRNKHVPNKAKMKITKGTKTDQSYKLK